MFCISTLIWNSSLYQFLSSLYLKCQHEQRMCFVQTNLSGIAWVLLIFQSSIAIPIPGLQYCIAIQNSKTCSSLHYMKRIFKHEDKPLIFQITWLMFAEPEQLSTVCWQKWSCLIKLAPHQAEQVTQKCPLVSRSTQAQFWTLSPQHSQIK